MENLKVHDYTWVDMYMYDVFHLGTFSSGTKLAHKKSALFFEGACTCGIVDSIFFLVVQCTIHFELICFNFSRIAMDMNVLGVRKMVKLCSKFQKLQVFKKKSWNTHTVCMCTHINAHAEFLSGNQKI